MRRENYLTAARTYLGCPLEPSTPTRNRVDLCREARCAPLRVPAAIVDADDLTLAPGEKAIVPVRWDRRVPDKDFWCRGSELSPVTVEPGLCSGGQFAFMICVSNESSVDAFLSRGDVLAEALDPAVDCSPCEREVSVRREEKLAGSGVAES